MTDYEVGYGKPPKQYQIGQPLGPKPGITKETREKQIANAIMVTDIRERMLKAILAKMDENPENTEAALAFIDAQVNKLLADTENRGLGMPTQQVDNTSSDGSMSPVRAQDAVLEALRNKHNKNDT